MSTGLCDEGMLGGTLAAAWLSRWPMESLRRKGVMGNVLAFGCKTAGEIDRGFQVIAQSRRWLEQDEGYYALSWTDYLEAILHMKRGSWLEARLACVRGLELVERELRGHSGQASMLHALLACIAYEFDEIDDAVEHGEQAMSSVSECSHADAVIAAYLTQSRLQRLRGDADSAIAVLREGQQMGERRELRRVTLSLAAEECAGLVRAGLHEEARLMATRFGFDQLEPRGDDSGLISDKALRSASRYLMQESPLLVIRSLDAAIESCLKRELAHRSVELLLIRAIAHSHAADWSSAEADLQQALIIAAPRGYVRVFLDEGGELGPLTARLNPERLKGSQAAPLARRLRDAFGKRASTVLYASTSVNRGLTRREVSILKRLESDLSNKEIAEAVFVSEGTLKWHLHNVYSKLEVKNRSGAIIRGKQLGLL